MHIGAFESPFHSGERAALTHSLLVQLLIIILLLFALPPYQSSYTTNGAAPAPFGVKWRRYIAQLASASGAPNCTSQVQLKAMHVCMYI